MTPPRIEDHPDYPFRSGREEALYRQVRAFLDAPAAGTECERLLHEFVVVTHRFAFLERLIQGDVLFDLPVHVDAGEPNGDPRAAESGERMAERERDLLDWKAGPAGELAEALDAMGIKVFLIDGEAVELEEVRKDLCGAFSFEGPVGPALMVGTSHVRPEAAFVLAHEFGHLVADVNPYRSRFCRWDPATLRNHSNRPEEVRADRFARALLLPPEEFRAAMAHLGAGGEKPGDPDPRWEQLTALFEVPPALLRLRIEDLHLPPLGARLERNPPPSVPVREIPTENGVLVDEDEEISAPAGLLALPERFVNLALAAYIERVLEDESLARFLRSTVQEALRVVSWTQIPRRRLVEE